MTSSYPPPPAWSPPGAQFRTAGSGSRTLVGTLIGLVVTPIGIGLAANGALDARQWFIMGDAGARWSSTSQMVGGALLLFLVATLAGYSPAGTVIAGLVWGLIPGIAHITFPDDTWRFVEDLPRMSDQMHQALHAWLMNGFALVTGLLLVGAGIAATVRRR
ncbi:hypothetical protein [Nocardia australiensis]|uniref:hypothetical protein n=1 Tax=Nocardia australiensis TaxID=2887191 RepID=UPI001D14BD86|nr:hypothetical protein [Nocardia australiensis]